MSRGWVCSSGGYIQGVGNSRGMGIPVMGVGIPEGRGYPPPLVLTPSGDHQNTYGRQVGGILLECFLFPFYCLSHRIQ